MAAFRHKKGPALCGAFLGYVSLGAATARGSCTAREMGTSGGVPLLVAGCLLRVVSARSIPASIINSSKDRPRCAAAELRYLRCS